MDTLSYLRNEYNQLLDRIAELEAEVERWRQRAVESAADVVTVQAEVEQLKGLLRWAIDEGVSDTIYYKFFGHTDRRER